MITNQKSKEAAAYRRRVALLVALVVHLGLLCLLVWDNTKEKPQAIKEDVPSETPAPRP